MNWIKKSLANTILSLIAIILVIVFSTITITSFNYIKSQIKSDVLEQTFIQSESTSNELEKIFEQAQLYTRLMAENRDIKQYLKEVKVKEDVKKHKNYLYVYDYLIRIKKSESRHFLAWVANESANFYLDNTNTLPEDDYILSQRPFFDIAMASDKEEFTPPYIEWASGVSVMSSIKALRDDTDEVYGFVAVDISLETFPKIISSSKIFETDKTFLITDQGNYVYAEDFVKNIEASIYDNEDPLSDYSSFIKEAEKDFNEIIYEGKDYYLLSYAVGINDWKIITLVDAHEIQRKATGVYPLIVSVMVVLFFFALGGIYIIVERRAEPYKMLVTFAEDIAKGEYSKNIPENYLERQDEMGAICNSFQKIIEIFRKENTNLEEQVSKINEVLEKQYAYILETEKAASLGNLVAGVSHEINTPLGVGVSTNSYIEQITEDAINKMSKGIMSKDELIKYFEKVTESSRILGYNLNRAADLVKSFKKIAVDQGSEVKEIFLLKPVIDDVVISLRNEYKRQKHEIFINCDEHIMMDSYPGLIAQLITNLMMNAIQHGFKHRDNGKIKINCWQESDFLYIIFEDNGHGITEETQQKMYDPFFTTNREEGNSGLGMSIIHNIVTQTLNGKIQTESVIEEYTRFTIMLPNASKVADI